MSFSHPGLLMMVVGLACLCLSVHAWRHRHDRTALSLALLLLAAATWSFFYGVEFSLTSLSPMRVALVLQYLGIAAMPVLFFVFAVRYSGNDRWLGASRVALLCIVPVFTVVMNATNDLHHLYYSSVSVGTSGGFSFLRLHPGPLYWLHVVYSHVLFVAGLVLLIQVFFAVSRADRLRVGYLLASALLTFALNVAYLVGFRPYGFFDLTPVGFAVMGVMLTVGIFTQRIFDIKPVALDLLFDGIPDAVMVLDTRGRVLNSNPAARVLQDSGLAREILAGSSEPRPAAQGIAAEEAGDREVSVGDRTFHATRAGLYSRGGSRLGTLVVMRDITERKRAEERLRLSRNQYQSLVNTIPGATCRRVLDGPRAMRFMSAGIEAISGYPAGDFVSGVGRSYQSLIHAEDVERVDRTIRSAASQGRPWEVEYRILHRDGGARWVYEKGMATAEEEGSESTLNAFILDITQQKRDREEIEQSHRELRRLATYLQTVREEERAAVAWELHDEIGQALSVIRMDVYDACCLLPPGAREKLRLEGTMGLLDETIVRLRRLYTGLRPGMLEDLGLSATIDWQTGEFARDSGIDCRVVRLDEVELPDDRASLAVYRVFQRALQTVVRDSGATRAEVRVERKDDHVTVSIADNGCITDEEGRLPGVAIEYAAMCDRLRESHGTLSTHRDASGERVTVISVPLRRNDADRTS